jgi:hypothetical protein
VYANCAKIKDLLSAEYGYIHLTNELVENWREFKAQTPFTPITYPDSLQAFSCYKPTHSPGLIIVCGRSYNQTVGSSNPSKACFHGYIWEHLRVLFRWLNHIIAVHDN